jgi:hypothetical protein
MWFSTLTEVDPPAELYPQARISVSTLSLLVFKHTHYHQYAILLYDKLQAMWANDQYTAAK